MDVFTQVFDHQPLLRIIVCRHCAIAVPPEHIITHLRRRHPSVPVHERHTIEAAARTLRDLAWEPGDLCLPRLSESPIPGLVQGTDGQVCQWEHCMYTCTTKQGIIAHSKIKHNWTNNQKRGGDARKKLLQPTNRLWTDKQPYQRVFRASGWPAFIALRAAVPERDADGLYTQVKAERKRIEDEEAAAAAQDTVREGIRQLPDPWLQLTGWLSHLKGRVRAELLSACLPPTGLGDRVRQDVQAEPDVALSQACNAMRHVIRRAFQAAQPDIVGRSSLEVIERRETGADSNEKPFYSNQKASTIHRYSEKLVSVLCYIWRASDYVNPPYTLSHNQQRYLTQMKHLAEQKDRGSRKELESVCLSFWIALLDHSLMDDEYKSALLSSVAVLGLKPDHLGGGWYPAHEFSPVLSALITTSKALVLYSAYREWVASQTDPDTSPSVYELVKDMAERFMQLSGFQTSISPMNRMLRLRTLARTIAKERNTSGLVAWDGDKILIDRQSFTMVDLQSMIKGLCETVRQRLLVDVLLLDVDESGHVRNGCVALPSLSMESLVDQPAELSAGFSFLQHPDNHFDDWQDWLLRRVLQEPVLRSRFRTGVDSKQWRDSAVHSYMKGVRRFKEGLFALVHLSAGAPARGTEITSILCENDASGLGYRGVFVEGGLVAFVTTYHKGYSFSKRVKTIHRYVPREVSELVVYFLALARPFIQDVQKMQGGVRGSTAFIWEPALEQQLGDDLESDDQESAAEACSVDDSSEDEEAREEVREERHVVAAKPTPANPDGFWGTDRIRRVLREYTFRFIGAALGTRSWRHAYPAIHRECAHDSKAREVVEMLYWDKDLVTNDAHALQSGHTLRTEESGYGRLLIESPNQTFRERQQFRAVSVDWHRLLGFMPARKDSHTDALDTAKMTAQRAALRWAALANADVKAEFRALVGDPEAEFRSKQEQALVAITQRRLRVLVVMATGAGKSLLFMLPAAIAGRGVSVVIAPLNALRDDLLDRCQNMGIKCAKWDGKRPPYWANIVLVTPEGAVSSSFGQFIDEKRMLGELDRIVIDECHVLLESSETWRPDVLKLTQMIEKGTQVVYLTATLPPSLQPAFLQVAGVDERSLTICRDDRTTRANIAYQVVDYPRGQLHETLVHLVAQKRQQFGSEAQIIVYCLTISQAKSLSKLLQCAVFYSEMGTEEEKTSRVRAFARGAVPLCTATNMLGLGLDAPGVRVVIHVDMCFLLRHYVQESGRGGRSGLPSESIVLVSSWRTKAGETRRSISPRLDAPAKAFLTSIVCRRIAIDSHMDERHDRRQCEIGEALCDLCSVRSRGLKRPVESSSDCESDAPTAVEEERVVRRRLMAAVSLEQRQIEIQARQNADTKAVELEQLDRHLRRWQGVCVICMVKRGEPESHWWQECPVFPAYIKSVQRAISRFNTGIQWQAWACCSECLAPQAICNRWVERDEGGLFNDRGRGLCQYGGVLSSAVAALSCCQNHLFTEWVRPLLPRYGLPTRPARQANIDIVLGRKVELGGRSASVMAKFFHAWEEGLVQPAAVE